MITSTSAGASSSSFSLPDPQPAHKPTAAPLDIGALIDHVHQPFERTPPDDMPDPPVCPGTPTRVPFPGDVFGRIPGVPAIDLGC